LPLFSLPLFTSILKFWKCECSSEGTEEAMELKPSPDKIQGAFTVMKFFAKKLLFVWGCCVVLFFSLRASASPGYICSDYKTEPECLRRIC